MMVNPSKREKELRKKVRGWRVFDAKSETFILKENAPDDVKQAFEELKHMK